MLSTLSPQTGWQAELKLRFAQRANKTIIASRSQRGPLAIQRPFYPEGEVCHAYVLHPPGGVVGGDELQMQFKVEPNAHALLTTPGATKFYRSAGLQAVQAQHFNVSEGCLEWLPQENIFFLNTNAILSSEIRLQGAAQYIGWEVHCLGRPAISEAFDQGSILFKTALYRNNKPMLLDRLLVNGERDVLSAAGLRGQPVFATLLATPADMDLLGLVRPLCEEVSMGTSGATLLNGVLVVRYLGSSTAQAQRLFRTIWQVIRPAITGRAAMPPRIWNT